MRTYPLLFCLCASLLASGCASKKLSTLDEDNPISQAVLDNPDVDAAEARVDIALAKVDKTTVASLPDVSVEVATAQEHTKPKTTGTTAKTNTREANVALSLPVSKIFSKLSAIKRAKHDVQAANSGYDETIQTALKTTLNAIVDEKYKNEILHARQKSLKNLKSFQSVTYKRFRVGAVSEVDLSAVQLSVVNEKAAISIAKAELAASKLLASSLVGNHSNPSINFKKLARLLPKSEHAALDLAQEQNPAIRRLIWEQKAEKEGVKTAKLDLFPDVTLSANGTRNFGAHNSGLSGGSDDMSVKLGIKIPLKQSLTSAANVKEQSSRHREVDARYNSAQRSVTTQTQVAWQNYQSANATIGLHKKAIKVAKQNLYGIKAANKLGTKTSNDELATRSALTNAEIALINSRINQRKSAHELAFLTGILGEMYGLSSTSN